MTVDLISGVMRAADRQEVKNAHRKLMGTKIANQQEKNLFSMLVGRLDQKISPSTIPRTRGMVEGVMAAADPQKLKTASANLNAVPGANAHSRSAAATQAPMISLESLMMSKLVDQMMPKDKDSIYGSGLAGDTWRGFAVNQMSDTISAADPLQLADPPVGTDLGVVANLFDVGSDHFRAGKTIRPFAM
jgi:hypothetical protein